METIAEWATQFKVCGPRVADFTWHSLLCASQTFRPAPFPDTIILYYDMTEEQDVKHRMSFPTCIVDNLEFVPF